MELGNKINNILLTAVAVILLTIGFAVGWKLYPTFKPCPEVTSDTIIINDTTWHHLYDSLASLPPKEKIKWLPQDTLFVPGDTFFKDVDTAAILKDYFSVFRYHWTKLDSGLLDVSLYTTVTENKPIKYELDYKILKPQTVVNNTIDNSVTYNKYFQFGVNLPVYCYSKDTLSKLNIMNVSLEASYVFPKGYVGVGWQPNTETINARAGVTLFKIKQIK